MSKWPVCPSSGTHSMASGTTACHRERIMDSLMWRDSLGREEKTEGRFRIPWGNCLVQRFGSVLRTDRGVRASECTEALGNASASPF